MMGADAGSMGEVKHPPRLVLKRGPRPRFAESTRYKSLRNLLETLSGMVARHVVEGNCNVKLG
jgi:hypothetical protein